ncbi:MAG: polysaccharide deacetylase family protein [Solirubrobacteraceae bacterium]
MTDVLVLCYHAISETWDAPLSVTPERFERQLEALTGRGYRGATFSDAVSRPPSGRTLAVTFDDAYRSVLELAHPVLERLGLPATVYTPTTFADSGRPMSWPGIAHWLDGDHRHELDTLSWSELSDLTAAGWEVGSHTVSHPRLTELGDSELARELTESKAACEDHLGTPCRSIAYPYGALDARVERATHAAGYQYGAALPMRFEAPRPLSWPRVGMYDSDLGLRMRLKTSSSGRRIRASALGERAVGMLRDR